MAPRYSVLYTHPTAQGTPFEESTRRIIAGASSSTFLLPAAVFEDSTHFREAFAHSKGDALIHVSTDGAFTPSEIHLDFASPIAGMGGQFGRCAFRTYDSVLRQFVVSSERVLDYLIVPEAMTADLDLEQMTFTKGISGHGGPSPSAQSERVHGAKVAVLLQKHEIYDHLPNRCLVRLDEVVDHEVLARDPEAMRGAFSEYLRIGSQHGMSTTITYTPERIFALRSTK